MIDYEMFMRFQRRAMHLLDEGPIMPQTVEHSDVRLAVHGLGVVIPVLREVEKILRVPLDDIEGLKTADRMLGCGGGGCGADPMNACLQCCRKTLQRTAELWSSCPLGYDVDGKVVTCRSTTPEDITAWLQQMEAAHKRPA